LRSERCLLYDYQAQSTDKNHNKSIFEEILEAASGKLTKAEISGYTKVMDIYTVGPVI
jgi:altronate dehydratase